MTIFVTSNRIAKKPAKEKGGNAPDDREQRAGQNVLHEIVRVAIKDQWHSHLSKVAVLEL